MWHQSLELRHVTAFQADTLRNLFGISGYRVHRLEPHGKPYARRLPLFLLVVASPDPGARPAEIRHRAS